MSEREISSGDSQQSLRQGGTAEGADWVRETVERLAIETVCPTQHQPCTVFEINMVKTFIEFGTKVAAVLSAAPRPDAGEGLMKRLSSSAKKLSALISIQPGNFAVVNDLQEAEWLLREAARALGREEKA